MRNPLFSGLSVGKRGEFARGSVVGEWCVRMMSSLECSDDEMAVTVSFSQDRSSAWSALWFERLRSRIPVFSWKSLMVVDTMAWCASGMWVQSVQPRIVRVGVRSTRRRCRNKNLRPKSAFNSFSQDERIEMAFSTVVWYGSWFRMM